MRFDAGGVGVETGWLVTGWFFACGGAFGASDAARRIFSTAAPAAPADVSGLASDFAGVFLAFDLAAALATEGLVRAPGVVAAGAGVTGDVAMDEASGRPNRLLSPSSEPLTLR